MTLWVGTSWKMNKTLSQATEFITELGSFEAQHQVDRDNAWPGVQPFVIPSFTALATVRAQLPSSSSVLLGAQNAHWEDAGAFTGEISVPQAMDAGAQIIEIGHSERREHFGETDHTVNLKVKSIVRNGLIPLLCVGEPLSVLQSGQSVTYVVNQVRKALASVTDTSRVLIAYEPIWAIGAGGQEPNGDEVAAVIDALQHEFGDAVAGILYGGSVNARNATPLLGIAGINGLFIGRSAWDVSGYLDILHQATQVQKALA